MRRALVEAVHHARHRHAFGRALIDQPAMQCVLADLALESEAATLLLLRLARAFDEVAKSFVPTRMTIDRVLVTLETKPYMRAGRVTRVVHLG